MTANQHPRNSAGVARKIDELENSQKAQQNSFDAMFGKLACQVAHFSGKPIVFLIAVLSVILWGASGPLFGFSDTWQLVINTSTTIITFLMVFLIQNTQNRDTLALQVKLAELIVVMQGADNKLATAEDMSDQDLQSLHEQYRERADETLEHLQTRRGTIKQAS